MDGAERSFDIPDRALPIVFAADVEHVIDAGTPGEVGRQCDAAGAHDRFADGGADRAGGAGDQYDLVLETPHASVVAARRARAQDVARPAPSVQAGRTLLRRFGGRMRGSRRRLGLAGWAGRTWRAGRANRCFGGRTRRQRSGSNTTLIAAVAPPAERQE